MSASGFPARDVEFPQPPCGAKRCAWRALTRLRTLPDFSMLWERCAGIQDDAAVKGAPGLDAMDRVVFRVLEFARLDGLPGAGARKLLGVDRP